MATTQPIPQPIPDSFTTSLGRQVDLRPAKATVAFNTKHTLWLAALCCDTGLADRYNHELLGLLEQLRGEGYLILLRSVGRGGVRRWLIAAHNRLGMEFALRFHAGDHARALWLHENHPKIAGLALILNEVKCRSNSSRPRTYDTSSPLDIAQTAVWENPPLAEVLTAMAPEWTGSLADLVGAAMALLEQG